MQDQLLNRIELLYSQKKKVNLSKEDLMQMINLLELEDGSLRNFIGELFMYNGSKSIFPLLEGMKNSEQSIKRGSVFLLGKIAKRGLLSDYPLFFKDIKHGLQDEDPKIRKNSSILLGYSKNQENILVLRSALENESINWVKPSIILAIGAIGGQEAINSLTSYSTENPEEQEAIRKALEHSYTEKSTIQFLEVLPSPICLHLHTCTGMEQILQDEIKEKFGISAKKIENGILEMHYDRMQDLYALRTFTEIIIPAIEIKISDRAEIANMIIDAIFQQQLLAKILQYHQNIQDSIRYRLEIRGNAIKHSERKQFIEEICKRFREYSSTFVNSPNNYDIEIRIIIESYQVQIMWKTFAITDNRFDYREKDVPASINPVIAAGIARLLKPISSPENRIWDPFCGSGTLLVERGLLTDYHELIGTDISQKAIAAAEVNIKLAKIKNIKLLCCDMRDIIKKEKFDEIITNMPFGLRVGDHKQNETLYRDFFRIIPQVMNKGGKIILFTQEMALIQRLFQESDLLILINVYRIFAGGLQPALFIGKLK